MYTVKVDSWEGVFYLINHWGKYKTFFKSQLPTLKDQYFKSERDAKRSITMLLKGDMGDEYKEDKFIIIPVSELEMTYGHLSVEKLSKDKGR